MPANAALIRKLDTLPANRLAEVEDFVDFISQREGDRVVTRAFMAIGETAFATIWHNEDDDAYDAL